MSLDSADAKTGPVLVHAGRRIDAAGAQAPRFPPANVSKVRERISEVLRREMPSAVVSSASCGSDLLLLEVAKTMDIQRIVVLPAAAKEFRKSSVADRPGPWGEMFDHLVREVVVEIVKVPAGDAGYLETNLRLLDRAESLARRKKAAVSALVVWDGKLRGDDDVTGHFLAQAKLRRMAVLEISTL